MCMHIYIYIYVYRNFGRAWPLLEEIRLKIFGSPDYPDFLDSLLSEGDSVYLKEDLFKVLGTPEKTCLMCTGTPVQKLDGKFGSRNFFESGLLRLWYMTCISKLSKKDTCHFPFTGRPFLTVQCVLQHIARECALIIWRTWQMTFLIRSASLCVRVWGGCDS